MNYIMELAGCLLSTTRLEKKIWAKAISTICFLVNRSPTTTLDSKILGEVWIGKPIDYSFLHVFGYGTYAHIPKDNRNNLDMNSIKCIFLGYVEGRVNEKMR